MPQPQYLHPKTLNKGQLQTLSKLWLHAFGSCQTGMGIFKGEGILKYYYFPGQLQ